MKTKKTTCLAPYAGNIPWSVFSRLLYRLLPVFCTAAGAYSAQAARLALLDFESPVPEMEARAGEGCHVLISTNFATSGRSSLMLHSSPWRSKADKCTSAKFPVSADFSGYRYISFDSKLVYHEGLSGTVTLTGGNKSEVLSFSHSRPGVLNMTLELPEWTRTTPVEHIRFTAARPIGENRFYFDNVVLLDGNEPSSCPVTGYTLELERRCTRIAAECDHLEDYARFLSKCILRGTLKDGVLLGKASSMEKVRPKAAFNAEPAEKLHISLAGNESESIQLVVAPFTNDLENVKVELTRKLSCGNASIPVKNVSICPVGFVKTKTPETRWKLPSKPLSGWWPDPILDFPLQIDVRGKDTQSFWIKVRADSGQHPGLYRSSVRVSVNGRTAADVPLEVQVRGYSLPEGFPLPTLTCSRQSPEMAEFLENHLIMRNNLYGQEPDFRLIDMAIAKGTLELVNLGWVELERDMSKPFNIDAWTAEYMPRLEKSYSEAKKRGILDKCIVYACDELPSEASERFREVIRVIKERLPGAYILTTSFDSRAGEKGHALEHLDATCPTVKRYVEEMHTTKKLRANGRKVWWYICKDPEPPFPNAYIECPAIDLRALMGAMTVKWRPDGFLYWGLNVWRKNKPVTSGPYTMWNPISFADYNGDGSWTYPGPDGKLLGSIRLENFRDGLEDYACAMLLESLGGNPCPGPDLIRTPVDFSRNPADYIKWRDSMSCEIERLMKKKPGATCHGASPKE